MTSFSKHSFFCKKCLTHDTFFKGGGSHAPDSCPGCGGTDCASYQHLTPRQKAAAREKFDIMWKEHRVDI